jgi:hypothetical protein
MNDPRRWTDEGGGATAFERELVGAGRDAGPSREQKRTVWGAIARQAAAAATGAGAASASGAAAATGLTVIKATTIVVLISAGVVATYRAMLKPGIPTEPSAATAPQPPQPLPLDERPLPPSASPALVADPAAEGPRPVKVAHPAPRPNAAAAAALAENARASQLREESAMILDARRVLRGGDPTRALTLLDAARARFPAGTLVQEREALTIEALVRAGQRTLATKRAEAFLRDYPKSPHAADVRSVVLEP